MEGCGYQSILRNVMKHHQTRHSQERPFMCEFCGTKFKSKVTLRTHTRIHTNERMFKCTYCDSAYIQRVGLLVSNSFFVQLCICHECLPLLLKAINRVTFDQFIKQVSNNLSQNLIAYMYSLVFAGTTVCLQRIFPSQ